MSNQNKNLDDDLALEADAEKPEVPEVKEYLSADYGRAPAKEENISLAKSKMILAKKLLNNIKENNERLIQLLSGFLTIEEEASISIGQLSDDNFASGEENLGETRVIEGVFDGENMIGPDGKQYSVPANYASKSKLVEGDILKLAITANGTFIYKQIGPIERARVVGTLERGSGGEYFALADGKKWRLLTASVTYFKGESGDEVVILVPKNGESKWAAVENVVRKSE